GAGHQCDFRGRSHPMSFPFRDFEKPAIPFKDFGKPAPFRDFEKPAIPFKDFEKPAISFKDFEKPQYHKNARPPLGTMGLSSQARDKLRSADNQLVISGERKSRRRSQVFRSGTPAWSARPRRAGRVAGRRSRRPRQ